MQVNKLIVNCFKFVAFVYSTSLSCYAQSLDQSKKTIEHLCSAELHGRGYVAQGVNEAATFLESEFSRLKLKKFGDSYTQTYSFPVNTVPGNVLCKVDEATKRVGYDFLVNADCGSIEGLFKLLHFNMNDSSDKLLLGLKIEKGFEPNEALVLHHYSSRDKTIIDSCKAIDHVPSLLITTEDKKLTHTISRTVSDVASLTFLDTVIANKEQLLISVKNEFIPAYTCKNLAGFIKGKKSDSLLVYSAHYDHLGMLGTDAMFPGASDNASGVSMILYLAEYFSKHKPPCNMAFILFSGEEAGLMGSEYFTKHPMFDLKKIKFLTNIDIMGNAEKGIVVVNGEVFKKQFDLLTSINDQRKLLPEVRIRGKAKNSDHYYFSEMGIPSIFIYSNGGLGFYHDVFDVANSISLTNYEEVAKLLIEFAGKL